MRSVGWGALWVALVALAWDALSPGDVAVADHAWATAERVAPTDPSHTVWVDAAWFQQQVAPWQEGGDRTAHRLRDVAARRRAALPDDRGGRREASGP